MHDHTEPDPHRFPERVANYLKNTAKGARRQRLRATRKGVRRNLQSKPPRRKDWTMGRCEECDDLDHERRERIMRIDEGDRRRAMERAAFQNPAAQPRPPERRDPTAQVHPGTVVSVSSGLCTVERDGARLQCHMGRTLSARETAFTNAVAVGDKVTLRDDGAGGGIIEEVLPRHSVLTRPDVFHSHRRQVIVANADQLLIVSSWREPFFWPELIDRCIIAAQRNGLLPIICLNKIDLVEDAAELNTALQPYEALVHHIIKTSAITGEGIDELRDLLRDKTTALTGLSGTGKSSLITAVQPSLRLRTSQVSKSRKRTGEGRHTTSQVTMFRLNAGGFVVDTPGIREFGLSGLRRRELAGFFPEISGHATACRFSNCAHLDEPGCAVLAGTATGAVPASRYHSYRAIRETLPE